MRILKFTPPGPYDNHSFTYPVGTGRKLNVHKTFRRRPGRLLNVLCTLNLRPVSTGYLRVLVIVINNEHGEERFHY